MLQDPVEVKRFEEGGFAVIQYLVPSVQGVRVDQRNLSAQVVRDGIWADVHLSKSGSRQEDEALLRGFLRGITITTKARRAAGLRSSERRFPLPGHGAVVMTVPSAWSDQVPRQSDDLATTIIFTPEIGGAFKVMVTPFWTNRKDEPLPSDREIKTNIDRSIVSVRDRALETSIPVRQLKRGGVQGYYFSATDRAPKPGEFKFTPEQPLPLMQYIDRESPRTGQPVYFIRRDTMWKKLPRHTRHCRQDRREDGDRTPLRTVR